jgi:putative acetyltransferase
MAESIEIREERQDDVAAIRDVNRLAFGQSQEGEIVDALRANGGVLLSLVAVSNRRIVGHVLYSPIVVGSAFQGAALGPMAVLPEYQRQGIGSQLVTTGNRRLAEAGCPFVIVLGYAEFYPRFGFTPASALGITCAWDVPDDVFMVLILDGTKTEGMSGLAQYRSEFSGVNSE